MSDRELVCAVPQTLPLTVTPPSYPEPQLTDDDCAVVIDVEDLRHLVTMASATGGWNEFEDDALDKARSMLADIDARSGAPRSDGATLAEEAPCDTESSNSGPAAKNSPDSSSSATARPSTTCPSRSSSAATRTSTAGSTTSSRASSTTGTPANSTSSSATSSPDDVVRHSTALLGLRSGAHASDQEDR